MGFLRFLVVLLVPCAWAGSLVSSVQGALKSQGDSPVVTIACCGAGRSATSVISDAVGASKGGVSVITAPTPLALVDIAPTESSDSAAAVAVADVLALEVHFSDLVEKTAHGLGQLLPLLQRSVQLRDVRPQPKLLLLTVTNFDSSTTSEADVSAFVAAQLDELVASLALPAEEAALSTADLLQLQCYFLPGKESGRYEGSLASLRDALTADSSSAYLFDARLSAPASTIVEAVGRAAARAPAASPAASPAEVHAAYQCGLLAEAAAREFQKGLSSLRKAADGGVVADFGEQATALVEKAIERFEAESASFKGAAPVSAARTALAEQLQRALYGPYRKQLTALQRLTLSKFRAKVRAAKPSAEIEEQMSTLVSESISAFDTASASLLPSGVRWTALYERASVLEGMQEAARAHVQTLQMQGLYLSKEGHRIPVDFSAHWLLPRPFGTDSRYDPVSASDEPAFKPQASSMKMRAEGYKPKTRLTDPASLDPKAMVFSDKMMQ